MYVVRTTKGQERKICEMYLSEFHSVSDIGRLLGLSEDKVRQVAKRYGLTKVQHIRWLTKDKKKMIKSWSGEISIVELAKKCGCTSEALRKYMIKHSIATNQYDKVKNTPIEITEEMKEVLLNSQLSRWEVSEKLSVSEKWVTDKRKILSDGQFKVRKDYQKNFSLYEKIVADTLIELDYVYFDHYDLLGYNVDFYLGRKRIIEVQGGYFHSKEETIEADKKKKQFFESKGYQITYIYDEDIKDKSKLKEKLLG